MKLRKLRKIHLERIRHHNAYLWSVNRVAVKIAEACMKMSIELQKTWSKSLEK